MTEPTEEEVVQFERLRAKAAGLHGLTWCVKVQWPRYTLSLRARECLPCLDHVLNGGACDPL